VGRAGAVRELGDTFDAMLDRLDRSFTAQRRFTAHASHELRTSLTAQRTALEIPLAHGRVPDDLRPAVQRALMRARGPSA
jgi:signal transduction histidine kinase